MPPHYPTPVKARLRGTEAYLTNHHIPHCKMDLFREFGIRSKPRGWAILTSNSDRRHPEHEKRGRPPIITPEDLRRMEELLWKYGFQARQLSWKALANEAGITASARTVERAMGTLHYRKCIACEKGWVSPSNAGRRVKAAQLALFYRPKPTDWHDIRWSDECHFTIGQQSGKIRIIRKPGERYCPDCIYHEPKKSDDEPVERYHVWAAVGWNFKSSLYFYHVPTNTNGKMSLQIYHDVILEGAIRPWLDAGEEFVLEEDGDSGHGTGRKSNIVKAWKEEHGLKHFFNTPNSPDLSPIENCWRYVKQFISANTSITGSRLLELILAGWERIPQVKINAMVDSMVVRMQDVIASGGQMTGW